MNNDPFLFKHRHIGPTEDKQKEMLRTLGVEDLDTLISETIPEKIRLNQSLELPSAVSETDILAELKELARLNRPGTCYIGMGYSPCVTPMPLQRYVFQNPTFYTAYTPYQPEISQGRLEALLNFQTLVCDLTQMEIANASLLDEGTAAAEAMALCYRVKEKGCHATSFFVDKEAYPQTKEVLRGRAEPLGIILVEGDPLTWQADPSFFGAFIQYPTGVGQINDYSQFCGQCHQQNCLVVVAADLLSLTLLKPPGEWGADIVVGNSQRLGIPMGYGGPHAAFFATKKSYQRQVPGRIIGISKDRRGNHALRMALQTREQHIRKEKATSNICTAQALLATMASCYVVYMGPKRLRGLAQSIHELAQYLETALTTIGFKQLNTCHFDTIVIEANTEEKARIRGLLEPEEISIRYLDDNRISMSVDETKTSQDIDRLCVLLATIHKKDYQPQTSPIHKSIPQSLKRQSDFLTDPVFNKFHSETKFMRYIKRLENKDLGLNTSMIPLGSCTMKLNAATELEPISWPEFNQLHPFLPMKQTQGYLKIFDALEAYLCAITGFDAVSLQPNAGSQGELAGLLAIKAYYNDKGEDQRHHVLVPQSAHGTNFASTTLAGMSIVMVKCLSDGSIDMNDLKAKAEKYSETLAAAMITYPSTYGVFDENIQDMCAVVHQYGGQVYMDGANMNAQVGLTNPAQIGADVCHLNLHKTFAIPHGGGGPGIGPIGVKAHLKDFLPGHGFVEGFPKKVPAVAAAPWGSASALLISYSYIRLMGAEGLTEASKVAILNANYMKTRLSSRYDIVFQNEQGRVAHEFILDFRPYRKSTKIEVEDIAKRLMDYGFHAPTLSWPVPGTLMIEPTESEGKDMLDQFCDTMCDIKDDLDRIQSGEVDSQDNVLKNAPHVQEEALSDQWVFPYSREKAVFPLEVVRNHKFWPTVSRIDQVYGDRNLVCTCTIPKEALATL